MYKLPVIAGCVFMLMTSYSEPHDEVLSEVPIEYQNYCFDIGNQYNVCPQLLIALMEAESSGNPEARNGHCIGLMQIDERDANFYLKEADPWDAYTNIEIATLILIEKGDSEEASGDIGMALAMYNGQSNPDPESAFVKKVLERSHELEVWDNGGW